MVNRGNTEHTSRLFFRNVQTPASPLVKGTNLIRAPPVVGQSLQNTPEKAATCEKKMPISQSSPNILRNDLKRGELKPAISGSGRKRVVKSAAATPSPLAKESNLTRTVQQTSSEGTRMGSSPLAFANSAASSEAKRTICSPLASKNSASSEGKRTIGSPLASAVLTPRRGNAASVRPHQGVPFNVKPTPSPTKSPGMSTFLVIAWLYVCRRKDGPGASLQSIPSPPGSGPEGCLCPKHPKETQTPAIEAS